MMFASLLSRLLERAPRRDVVRIRGSLEWRIEETESGGYVATTELLGATVQAPTWNSLMGEISAMQHTLLKSFYQTNELEAFLADTGWTAIGNPTPDAEFDLPFVPRLVQRYAAPLSVGEAV